MRAAETLLYATGPSGLLGACSLSGARDELAACKASELGFRIEADRAKQSLRHVEARANAWLTFVSIVEATERGDSTSIERYGRRLAELGLEPYEVTAVSRALDWATAVAKSEPPQKQPHPDRSACFSWLSHELAALFE